MIEGVDSALCCGLLMIGRGGVDDALCCGLLTIGVGGVDGGLLLISGRGGRMEEVLVDGAL